MGRGINHPLPLSSSVPDTATPRMYSSVLTATLNDKGVLDVDTVKGCTAGMSARPMAGCYDACYAAKIAKFRGINFSVAVTRTVDSTAKARAIERAVRNAPLGFFRIGTMGDPCHAWEATVETVEWLSDFARPVIITKHWHRATNEQLMRLVACRTVLNTSLSALDTAAELSHRMREFFRFKAFGGDSVARIVSCDFNRNHPEGERMATVQDTLFRLRPTLDNPLRAPRSHPLVERGIIRLAVVRDLVAKRTVSINPTSSTYLGHCSGCKEVCGVALVGGDAPYSKPHHNPRPRQASLWGPTNAPN